MPPGPRTGQNEGTPSHRLPVTFAERVAAATSPDRDRFLGVSVAMTALPPAMAFWHAFSPRIALATPVVGAMVVDWFRLGKGIESVGYVNLAIVWPFAQTATAMLVRDRASQWLERPALSAAVVRFA